MRAILSTRNTFLAVLFLGLFAMAARNVIDPDLWWHLKTGEYIVEHHAVPRTDPFSFTRAGQPWVAHEWLFDVLLYGLYRAAGWGALIALFAFILCAAFFLLYLRCPADPLAAGVVTLWGALATVPLWGVRPQILSLLLTSVWLLILERSEGKPSLLWWTLPLTLLWVNLHAGFALGLALSLLFMTGELVECKLGLSSAGDSSPRLRVLGLTLLLDLLLVPVNPNSWRMYRYPLETLSSAAMQNLIAEWASPNFHRAEYRPFLLLLLAAVATLASLRARIRLRDLLLTLAGTYAALSSIRMIPLFVLVAVPWLSRALGTRSVSWDLASRSRSASQNWLNAAILLGMAAFAVIQTGAIIRHQPQAEAENFPAAAVQFLAAHPPSGPIFNHYDWGGYLIWRLPANPVFIDGRADLYGEALLNQFAEAFQLKNNWKQPLEQWKIRTVLVPGDSALATALRLSPGWTVVYESSQAVVLERQGQNSLLKRSK